MGALSTQAILTQGLEQAGDATIRGPALVALNAWLRSRAHERGWPSADLLLTGNPVSLASGASSVVLGKGGAAFSAYNLPRIQALYLAEVGKKPPFRRLVITPNVDQPCGSNPLQASAITFGVPETVTMVPGASDGQTNWTLYFHPACVRAFDLYVYPYAVPDAQTDSGSDYPWYPNDETMAAAVELFALRHMREPLPRIQECEGRVARLLGCDRALFNSRPGHNAKLELAADCFESGLLYSPGIVRLVK